MISSPSGRPENRCNCGNAGATLQSGSPRHPIERPLAGSRDVETNNAQ